MLRYMALYILCTVFIWFGLGTLHLMMSLVPGTVLRNPEFPAWSCLWLILVIGFAMGTGIFLIMIIGAALENEILIILRPMAVGVVMGILQGVLVASPVVGVPPSVTLTPAMVRLVAGGFLGLLSAAGTIRWTGLPK